MAATEGQIRWTTAKATEDFNSLYVRFTGAPSLDEVIAHYLYCYEAAEGMGIGPRPRDWWGMSHEQIAAQVAAVAKRHRKGAGLRALKAKLGRDGAEGYISWKAGRHISLK